MMMLEQHQPRKRRVRRHHLLLLAALTTVVLSSLTTIFSSSNEEVAASFGPFAFAHAQAPATTTPRPAPTVATHPGVVTLKPRTRTESETLETPTPAPQRQPIKFLPPIVGEVCVYVGSVSSIVAATVGPYPLLPMQMSRLALLFEIAECGDGGGVLPPGSGFGTHFPVSAFAGLHLQLGQEKPTIVDFYRGGIVANVVCAIAVTALLFVGGVVLNCLKPQLAEAEDGGIVWKAVTAAMFPSSMIVVQSLLLEGTIFMITATLIETTELSLDVPITVSMIVVVLLIFAIAIRGVRRVVFVDRVVKGYSTTIDVQQREQCLGTVVRSSLAAILFYGRETWHGGRSRATPTNVYGNREGAKLPPNARRIALFYKHLRPPKAATITIDDVSQLFVGHYFFFEVLLTVLVAVFHAVVPKSCDVGIWGVFVIVFLGFVVSVVYRPHLVTLAQVFSDLIQFLTVVGLLAIGISVSLTAPDSDGATRAALRKTSDIAGLAGMGIALLASVLSVFASIAFWCAGGRMIPDGGEMRALYLSTSNPVSPNSSSSNEGRLRPGSNERTQPLLGPNTPPRRLGVGVGNNNNNNNSRRAGSSSSSSGAQGRARPGIPLLEPLSAATIQRVVGDWPVVERHPSSSQQQQQQQSSERASDVSIITIDDSPVRGSSSGKIRASRTAVADDKASMASLDLSDGSDVGEIDLDSSNEGTPRGGNNLQQHNPVPAVKSDPAAIVIAARRRAATVGPINNPLKSSSLSTAADAGTTFFSAKDLRKAVLQVQAVKDAEDEAAEEAAAAAAASSGASSPSSPPPPLDEVGYGAVLAAGSAASRNPFMSATPSSSSSSMAGSPAQHQQQQQRAASPLNNSNSKPPRSQSSGASNKNSNSNNRSDSASSQRHTSFQFGGALASPAGSRSNSAVGPAYVPPLSVQPPSSSRGSDGWRHQHRSGSLQPAMNELQLEDSGNNNNASSGSLSPLASRVVSSSSVAAAAAAAASNSSMHRNDTARSSDSPPPPPGMPTYDSSSSAGGSPPALGTSTATPPPNVFDNVVPAAKKSIMSTTPRDQQQQQSKNKSSAIVGGKKSVVQQRMEDLARSDSLMSDYHPPSHHDGEEEI